MKKTLILGASPDATRFSYKATVALLSHNHPVVPVGVRDGFIEGVAILKGQPPVEDIDTVTLYINPLRQIDYYNYIIDLKPKRVIFNPGTENEDFMKRCEEQGIQVLEACTLVLLSVDKF